MRRRPPRATRTDTLFPLHDALPISTLRSRPRSSAHRSRSTRAAPHRRRPVRPASPMTKRPPPDAHEPAPALSRSRSEEHTSELQSLMHIPYAVFSLQKKIIKHKPTPTTLTLLQSITQDHRPT